MRCHSSARSRRDVDLVEAFLHAILAERPLSGVGRIANAIGGEGLRDGNQRDARRRPSRGGGRGVDPAAHGLQLFGDVTGSH